MSRDIWNPRQYRAYSSHRARPFFELLARVDVETPAYVVDLGCGPGERTADLAVRWPSAVIEGIDSSLEMITEAHRMTAERPRPRLSAANGRPVGSAGTSHTDAPDAEVPQSPVSLASEASAASPSTPAVEASPDPSTRGASPAGPGQIADATIGGVGENIQRPVGGHAQVGGTSSEVAAGAPGPGDGPRGQVGEADRGDGSPPGLRVVQDGGTLRFSVGDLAEWVPDRPVDVIFSNAALQWVPDHQRLLPRWVEALAPGGRLAFSMPGNFDGPSHRILRELCESPRWRDRLGQVNRHNIVGDPADYFELLSDLGCEVDAWETTYLQVLHGADPVLEWMKGTALRPAFDALPDEGQREEFLAELTALLREAYPPGPHGTLFPFRRIFVVARSATSASNSS
jgi:trans-aconitate 2-methyltransferase